MLSSSLLTRRPREARGDEKPVNPPDGEGAGFIRRQLCFQSRIEIRFKKLSPALKAAGRARAERVELVRDVGTRFLSPVSLASGPGAGRVQAGGSPLPAVRNFAVGWTLVQILFLSFSEVQYLHLQTKTALWALGEESRGKCTP